MSFEVRDRFYMDGEPFRIISGSIHYFRVVPEYWRDRLEKLKALGCNTVETYIPWNMHEPQKGKFCFDGMLDVERFVKLAQELGLESYRVVSNIGDQAGQSVHHLHFHVLSGRDMTWPPG